MPDKVRLLSDSDIFDVYAAQELLHSFRELLSEDDLAEVRGRVYEIHGLYVDSCKARIKAEAVCCGVQLPEHLTLDQMLGKVRQILEVRLTTAGATGRPVNLMAEILRSHQMAGSKEIEGINLADYGIKPDVEPPKDKSVDPEWFTKGDKSKRLYDNPKWAEISRAYVALEAADSAVDMILAIDYLNSLQHNSFHMLIDLQSGRMLEGCSEGENHGKHDDARRNVQRVLDICMKKADVYEFAEELSPVMRKLLGRYR